MIFWVLSDIYHVYITCIIHFDFARNLFIFLTPFLFEQDITLLFAICELHMVTADENKSSKKDDATK